MLLVLCRYRGDVTALKPSADVGMRDMYVWRLADAKGTRLKIFLSNGERFSTYAGRLFAVLPVLARHTAGVRYSYYDAVWLNESSLRPRWPLEHMIGSVGCLNSSAECTRYGCCRAGMRSDRDRP